MSENNKMGIGSERKLLLTMEPPIVLSMLVQALYNIVESAFVSCLGRGCAVRCVVGDYCLDYQYWCWYVSGDFAEP